jgi:uncharacterized membrane protein
MPSEEKPKLGIWFWTMIAVCGVIITCCAYMYLLSWNVFGSEEVARFGWFGDSFGGLNALFTGLAFAGLIVTILLQNRQLNEQRQASEEQSRQISQESFENTFFKLLTLHHEIVQRIGVSGKTPRETFESLNASISNAMEARSRECEAAEEVVKQAFMETRLCFGEISHYLGNLYNILCYVDGNPIVDRQLYADILRSQLSEPETRFLFYFGISPGGQRKFKPLIERYGLLQHLAGYHTLVTDFDDGEYIGLYDLSAFGNTAENWARSICPEAYPDEEPEDQPML